MAEKKATDLVSQETLAQAIQEGNLVANKMMRKNPNDPNIDQLVAAVGRLEAAQASGMFEESPEVKQDVDFVAQMRQQSRGGFGAQSMAQPTAAANGSDGFVTDRDDKGQPKKPEVVDVPRVAGKKKEAEPVAAPAPAPAKANPIDYIPTEALLKVIEAMPKDEDFAQNKGKQDALIELTNILKTRPVLPPEPPKGQPAQAAPAPAAAPVASAKKADGQIYRQDNPQPKSPEAFVEHIPQAQGAIPEKNAKGEPFGGKQAPPFGSEKKEEKAEDKKEATVDEKTAVAPPGWEGTVKEMKKEDDIENPWALAWSMKNKGYTPHAAKWILKRKGASYLKKIAQGVAGGAWTSNQSTMDVEEGKKVPEIAQAHAMRDDNTGIKRPETTLPEKLAAEISTSKALKDAEAAQEKLKALYLDVKPLTQANNTRDVRIAVESVYAAYSAFDAAVKILNKQQMQEEDEKKAQEEQAKKKKSSFKGLAVAAAE